MSYLDNSICKEYNAFVESKATKTMPWIGLYIAAASLVCLIFILADVCNASRKGQVWFPCRYFSLNAASLAILAVASKLSVDLTSAMPGGRDQMAKLSTSVLVCVSMAIFIPTLGAMKDTELVANFIALVILIITIIADLSIQLTTGVIDVLLPENILVVGSMVYLLMVCCSTVVALASIKNELQVKYEKNHRSALDKLMSGSSETKTRRLEDYLRKFSMMSHTGWPYMVLGRSRLGSTTAFICTVDTLCLSIITFYAGPLSFELSAYCDGQSNYKWSTFLICYIQVFATLAGLMVVSPKLLFKPTTRNIQILSRIKNVIKLEGYWTQWLVEIKQRPLFLFIHNKRCRKFVHHAKYHFCNFLIAMQFATALMIKLFGSLYDLLVAFPLRSLYRLFRILYISHLKNSPPLRENLTDLRPYILYLEGEEELTDSMMEIALKATERYIKMAKKDKPNNLITFLETSLSSGFKGVLEFDREQVGCLDDSEEPPTHCWSLPVVTMTTIAVSLPNIGNCLVHNLLQSVREGLVFVKLIEENLNKDTGSIKMRKAAEIVWEQVHIHGRWFDVKLNEIAARGNHPTIFLNILVDSAKNKYQAFKGRKEKTSIWPIEAVASNSLYRICQTLLRDGQNENSPLQTTDDVFKMLSSRICDVLGACLTNLEHVILMECSRSTIENMNETAQRVLRLFGRTIKVMELLDGREKPNLSSDKLAFIDEWRCSDYMTNQLP